MCLIFNLFIQMRKSILFKALACVFVCGLSFAACSSDDDEPADNKKWLLSKVKTDESDVFIEYDAQNRITMRKEVFEYDQEDQHQSVSTLKFEYDTDGKLKKKTSTSDEGHGLYTHVYLYTYSNDTVYVSSEEDPSYISAKLALNAKGQVTKKILNGEIETFEYDQAGNVLKRILSAENSFSQTSIYTYDTAKLGPWAYADLASWVLVSEVEAYYWGIGSPVKTSDSEYTSVNSSYNTHDISTYDCRYNEYNQVIEMTIKNEEDGDVYEETCYFSYVAAK